MPDRDQFISRQKVLADFGELALRSEDLDEILTEACRLVGEALGTDIAKLVEIEADGEGLVVRAGVGWQPGIVGEERLPMSERSSETYSITAGEPVISQDINHEGRFEFAEFLKEHGVISLVNVPIFLPGEKAYGLLQVDSRERRDFDQEDIEFLRTYSTILGPVIDRLHKAHSLRQALVTNQRLLRELQHRVKNHIGIISSLVRMRTGQVDSDETRGELRAIGERIDTLRLLHEQLYIAETDSKLPLRPFIVQLVENLCHLHEDQSGKVRLDFVIEEIELTPEVAVPVGLILNEFVTNSLKYAFDGSGGTIAVSVDRQEGEVLRLRISDNGKGLPSKIEAAKPGAGTGMKLIDGLAHQIGANPIWSSPDPGTALCLEFNGRD
jgi:two-component sensor histidine kinase